MSNVLKGFNTNIVNNEYTDDDCFGNYGGVKEVIFFDFNVIKKDLKFVGNNYRLGLTLKTTPSIADDNYIAYKPKFGKLDYRVSHTVNNGVDSFEHNLSIKVNKRQHILDSTANNNHNALWSLTGRGKKVLAIVVDNNGNYYALGWWSGLRVNGGSGGSGTNKNNGTTYDYSFKAPQPWFEISITDAFKDYFNI